MHSALTGGHWRAIAACLLTLGLCGPVQAQVVDLTRPQALNLARTVFLRGDASLANAIARRLVEVDPNDVEALLLLCATEEVLGNPEAAVIFGRRAWDAAARARRPVGLRYEIARQTGHAAMSAERVLAAQFWLRRAIAVAPNDALAEQSQSDLDIAGQFSPLKSTLSFQLIPTTNINGGSVSDVFLIDDVVIGGLSGWSEAQPGVIAVANLDLLYALPGGNRDRFGISLTEALPKLTPAAARQNPDLDDADLQSQSAVLRYEHDLQLPIIQTSGRMTLSGSQSWTGGTGSGAGLRGKLEVSLLDSPDAAMLLSGLAERQWPAADGEVIDGYVFTLDSTQALAPLGGVLQMGIEGSFLRSDAVNNTYDAYEVSLGFAPDAPIGPVAWSALLTLGAKDYPRYQPIGGGIDATNGRHDTSAGLSFTLRPQEGTIFGLTPYLALSHQANWSNISRYETQNNSVTLGLSQSF